MGLRITLRPMQLSDLPRFREWLFLPHVAAWYHEPEDWIAEIEKQDEAFSFVRHFMVQSEGKTIGFCQYYPYWLSGENWHGEIPIEGTYSIDYFIGDVTFLRKGYGKEIIRALMEQIQTHASASRVIVQPEPENQASCGVLLASGFHFDQSNQVYLYEL